MLRGSRLNAARLTLVIWLVGSGCGGREVVGGGEPIGVGGEGPAPAGVPAAPVNGACDPSWHPPSSCARYGDGISSITEICLVDGDGHVVPAAERGRTLLTLPPGRVGLFVRFDDKVPRLDEIKVQAYMGPVNVDDDGPVEGPPDQNETAFCSRLASGGLWVTLPDPVTTPEQVAVILEYRNDSSLARSTGGWTAFVVRFYAAGIP
jgi:hypothetical protein